MAEYFQTNSTYKAPIAPTLEEKQKKFLIKKAMELSISCNYQIFLAVIDQKQRLSIFTNEGNPEQFIETYLTNVSYLKDNLSLKDYSNICQEETALTEEKEVNSNSLTSADYDRKPITNYFYMNQNSIEGGGNIINRNVNYVNFSNIPLPSSFHSKEKNNKESTGNYINKTKKSNNPLNDASNINLFERQINDSNYNVLRKDELNQLREWKDNGEDNGITTENNNIFESISHEYLNKDKTNSSIRYKHGENKKIRIVLDSTIEEDNNRKGDFYYQANLNMKRNRDYDMYEYENFNKMNNVNNPYEINNNDQHNNISPQLSDKNDFFFQNDNNQLLKTNYMFSPLITTITPPNVNEFEILLPQKTLANIKEDNKVNQANNNLNTTKQNKKEDKPCTRPSKAKNKIIIIEEGGKAKILKPNNENNKNDSYDYITYSRKKSRSNHIIFHSN